MDHLKQLEKKGFTKTEKLNLEKHHILPYHDKGTKNGPVVICTFKNHTLAHYYRYLSYKQKGDLTAFLMRWDQRMGVKQKALLGVATLKKKKCVFLIQIGNLNRVKKLKKYQKQFYKLNNVLRSAKIIKKIYY